LRSGSGVGTGLEGQIPFSPHLISLPGHRQVCPMETSSQAARRNRTPRAIRSHANLIQIWTGLRRSRRRGHPYLRCVIVLGRILVRLNPSGHAGVRWAAVGDAVNRYGTAALAAIECTLAQLLDRFDLFSSCQLFIGVECSFRERQRCSAGVHCHAWSSQVGARVSATSTNVGGRRQCTTAHSQEINASLALSIVSHLILLQCSYLYTSATLPPQSSAHSVHQTQSHASVRQ
jgi:hypothetical protein